MLVLMLHPLPDITLQHHHIGARGQGYALTIICDAVAIKHWL